MFVSPPRPGHFPQCLLLGFMKKARETVIALLGVISTLLAAGNGKRRSLALITDPDLQGNTGPDRCDDALCIIEVHGA